MNKPMAYGMFLILSLGVAWARWTKEPSTVSDQDVGILYGEAVDIEKVEWKTEKEHVILEPKKDDHGSYIWVEYSKEAAKEGEKPVTKTFKAGDTGLKILEVLSPLVAKRKFEQLSAEKEEEVGLKESKISLKITRKGQTSELQLGEKMYSSYYVRDKGDGSVFLMDSSKVQKLKTARTSLPDRRLWSFKKNEIVRATITDNEDKSIVLEHKNWQDKQNAKWINSAAPDDDNTQISTWIGKALRVSSKKYAGKELDEKSLKKKFSMKLEKDGSSPETINIYSDEKEDNWYGKSEHTRAYVSLRKQSISELNADVSSLLGPE